MMTSKLQKLNNSRLTHISFFSGAMGLDLGLELSGFNTKLCIEIDTACRKTISLNSPRINCPDLPILDDVTKYSSSEVLHSARLSRGEVTLIAGGPPCQAFSTAGKRGSVNDPRGTLVGKYLELIDEIKPRFFVFENVRGILSAALRHRPLKERGEGYPPLEPDEELGSLLNKFILPSFKKMGYEVVFALVDTADYGVPQNRERVIFIGSRDYEFEKLGLKELHDIVPPTHSKNGVGGLQKWKTLGDVLNTLQDDQPEFTPYSSKRAEIFDKIPAGGNWRFIREHYTVEYLKEIMGGAYDSGGGKVGFWRRLSLDKPSPTLMTSPSQKSTALCHPLHTRPLSVKEYAAIQTFPEWWEFAGSTTAKYTQIGNAVPVKLAQAIGEGILNVMSLSDQLSTNNMATVG